MFAEWRRGYRALLDHPGGRSACSRCGARWNAMWKWSTCNAHWPGQSERWTRVACHAASGLANQRPGNERAVENMPRRVRCHANPRGVARNYGGKTVTVTAPLRATGIRVRPRVTVATVLSIASGVWYVSQCAATGVERSLALPNAPACERFPVGCPSHGDQTGVYSVATDSRRLCVNTIFSEFAIAWPMRNALFVTSERIYKRSVIAESNPRLLYNILYLKLVSIY